MEEVDIVIIGAGVVGLAIARELSGCGKEILVLEKNKTFGQETSSRNSEVIHAGMNYPKNTLKSKLCIQGRRLLYEICREYGIPHKKTGKFIVATEKDEVSDLEALLVQGRDNGVEGLSMVEKRELKQSEPNVFALSALFSFETGIVDSHRLMRFYLDYVKDKGGLVSFNSEIVAIENERSSYKISVLNDNNTTLLRAGLVINSTGLDSDSVAQKAGFEIDKLGYRLHYCKGEYFRVKPNEANSLNHLVYPVVKPKSSGLGIHATLDLLGGIRLGPDDAYLNHRIKDYTVEPGNLLRFYASASKFIPALKESDLYPDISGIRPKLQRQDGEFRDFIIREESKNGFSGFFNLIGIESPGLTASPAIGKYIKEMVFDYYNN